MPFTTGERERGRIWGSSATSHLPTSEVIGERHKASLMLRQTRICVEANVIGMYLCHCRSQFPQGVRARTCLFCTALRPVRLVLHGPSASQLRWYLCPLQLGRGAITRCVGLLGLVAAYQRAQFLIHTHFNTQPITTLAVSRSRAPALGSKICDDQVMRASGDLQIRAVSSLSHAALPARRNAPLHTGTLLTTYSGIPATLQRRTRAVSGLTRRTNSDKLDVRFMHQPTRGCTST